MIFSEEKYFIANEIPNYHLFQWEHAESDFSMHLTYSIDNQKATSIPSAPYAGFAWRGKITPQVFEAGLTALIESLKSQGLESIEIRQAPDCFGSVPYAVFDHLDFQKHLEINHHIDLKNYQLHSLHKMQQRRINKCLVNGFTFQQETLDQAGSIHDFISKCRKQQGLVINITKEKFLRITSQLPNTYALYSIFDPKGQRCAATVCISVDNKVVYNYLPAFDRSYASHSPLAFLLHQLNLTLMEQKVKYLDLGISSINGKAQGTLIDFKERMGGLRSDRPTFFKQL
ncbi:GNAT family N-acetyltransferase [Reichenbachiella ulvae]|uniref:GNAT family N-acetyltransferase n=1 Tax=Reichenbachiella ulvae TaxID=2980104 RepID=A0ABT3CYL7_9BACT|nr:GNAT family N-acetyltransferase [Reichenbachiella ulvae]MCV9388790.1 GNAT family N-acetyltransferase [Reichenbachiella ulvae]